MSERRRLVDAVARRRAGRKAGQIAAEKAPAATAALSRLVHRSGDLSGPGDALAALAPHLAMIPETADRRVVVLADPKRRTSVAPWLRHFRGSDLHVIASEEAPEWDEAGVRFAFAPAQHLNGQSYRMRSIGSVDVIVDLVPASAEDHEAAWRRLFYHLRPGGVWILAAEAVKGGDLRAGVREWVETMITADVRGQQPAPPRADRQYADATSSVALSREFLVVKKRGRHYLKLRDADANVVLAARRKAPVVQELTTLPEGVLTSRAVVTSHESAVPITGLDERLTYPPMHLRHYRGRLAYSGASLLWTEDCVLPESYRWQHAANPSNPRLVNISPTFARIPAEARPRRTLRGDYYLVDSTGIGHFGHFLTESIARLWGWDEAKRRNPDLKALYMTFDQASVELRFERRLLTAYGIPAEDIVTVDRPVYVNSLVSATTMWQNSEPYFAHPQLVDVWRRITAQLADPDAPKYERIFISRSDKTWRRSCRNLAEVEALFAAHGFDIVYPEQLDLATQAGIFEHAPVVAGLGGSALFNVLHSKNLQTLIVLNHEAYTARNEHLYASLIGGATHYFWSPSDVAHPPNGWSREAFDSGWEFDFARNREPLEKLLNSL